MRPRRSRRRPSRTLDKEAGTWVQATLKKLTLDEKVGQMLVSSFQSSFHQHRLDEFEALVKAVHEQKVGGFHVFGGSERVPAGAAQSDLRRRHARPAARGGVDPQSAAGDLAAAAAQHRGLRSGRRLPHRGRDRVSAADGVSAPPGDERLAYEAGRVTRSKKRARSASTSTSRRSSTSTTIRATR